MTIILKNPINLMKRRSSGHDFMDPMVLKILRETRTRLSILGINYLINGIVGRTINLNVVKNHLLFLVKDKKISENVNKESGIAYYRLIL